MGQITSWWSLKSVEYLGDIGSLCPAQECVADLANMGEGRVCRMWKKKENL